MKKIITAPLLLLLFVYTDAQQQAKKPAASPEAAFTQQFGESEITVQYARPLTRGRKIFGGLVPYDSLWRTGAGDCTLFTINEEVIIGGKKISAGVYSVFTIPGARDWTIILNTDTSLHGTMGYTSQKDVHRFVVPSMKSERFYESFTIEINDLQPNGDASLNLIWENTIVKIPLQSPLYATIPANPDTVKKDITATPGNEKIKAQFAPVLAAYYELKDALVTDNSKLAAEKAKAMKTALQAINIKDWDTTSRSSFETVYKKLETDATHIGDNPTKIDHQREYFVSLSGSFSALVKALKANDETAYYQFCPMANDGKGAYWLSKQAAIRNPYYGKSMLTCGSVKETLKQ